MTSGRDGWLMDFDLMERRKNVSAGARVGFLAVFEQSSFP